MTVVDVMSAFLEKYGLEIKDEIQKIAGISVYPKEYFCPKDFETGKLNITSNTYSIHHLISLGDLIISNVSFCSKGN